METKIRDWIQESIRIKQAIYSDQRLRKQIENAANVLLRTIRSGGVIYSCGNGGSASDSAHFVGELLNRFSKKREYPIAAVDLSAPNSTLTAIANDYSFDEVFSKQIQALGGPQDTLFAISTSGKSKNIEKALIKGYTKAMSTILLTGDLRDDPFPISLCITVPSSMTPIIQESHIMIIHIICYLIDEALEAN